MLAPNFTSPGRKQLHERMGVVAYATLVMMLWVRDRPMLAPAMRPGIRPFYECVYSQRSRFLLDQPEIASPGGEMERLITDLAFPVSEA